MKLLGVKDPEPYSQRYLLRFDEENWSGADWKYVNTRRILEALPVDQGVLVLRLWMNEETVDGIGWQNPGVYVHTYLQRTECA